MRLIYIDDSGAPPNTVVYGWVELHAGAWRDVLRGWLNWRHEMYRDLGIPADYELHATKFVGGRGRPTGTSWDQRKAHRAEVMVQALRTIGSLPGLRAGAVFQRDDGRDFRALKSDTYARLVRWLDAKLTADGDHGLVIMDGNGTDPGYRVAHRDLKLATRSLIEDPLFQGSHHSQWVQIADLVAYSAYMRLARIPNKAFSWDWYDLLAPVAVTGPEPLDLNAP
ncbi:DUF3800 domain-containing protein [Saccharopolyspora shandongensis]|uniref:DUF3800 domain-containing protein n=1 Tax=Saccharopolyspora shandongensis TaxID=418495 RepID=UPI00340CBF32